MGVVMASTWNPALIRQVGVAIAQEAKVKNRQVIYGPDINITRSPQGGRDFEELSEDPYLTSQIAVADINGLQSQGVAACPKHYRLQRPGVQPQRHQHRQVDERTLHEIYLPPFQAAVQQAHVWAVMAALSRINGTYMTENRPLLTDLLKDQWGWDGLVICDWGAVHSTVAAANAGMDEEMPAPEFFSPAALTDALQQEADHAGRH